MRRLIPLLLCIACNPTVSGTRPPAPEATPEEVAAQIKELKEAKEAKRAKRRARPEEPTPIKINVNTATADELKAAIEHLDDKEPMSANIIKGRPYDSVEQFRTEMLEHVVPEYFLFYVKYVYIPIRFDTCEVTTLRQIPGLTDEEAAALIEGRPYGTTEAFVAKLTELVTADELETARPYIEGP